MEDEKWYKGKGQRNGLHRTTNLCERHSEVEGFGSIAATFPGFEPASPLLIISVTTSLHADDGSVFPEDRRSFAPQVDLQCAKASRRRLVESSRGSETFRVGEVYQERKRGEFKPRVVL